MWEPRFECLFERDVRTCPFGCRHFCYLQELQRKQEAFSEDEREDEQKAFSENERSSDVPDSG